MATDWDYWAPHREDWDASRSPRLWWCDLCRQLVPCLWRPDPYDLAMDEHQEEPHPSRWWCYECYDYRKSEI